MGTPQNTGSKVKEPAGNLVIVGVICLAIGLGVGYYFGKTLGSTPMGTVAGAPAEAQGQAPAVMDPAEFMAKEKNFKSMLQSNPKDLNALVPLGNLYYDNNKFTEAVDAYGRALEIDPSNINVRTDRGSCYWSLGQADAALEEFRKSLQLNPSHAQTLFNMGIVYLHGKNDIAEAKKYWEKLLETNPDYPQRARIQEMLTSMSSLPTEPASPTPKAAEQKQPAQPGASKMEDLFNKMKK